MENMLIIAEYCKHYNYQFPKDIKRPLRSNDLKQCVNSEWDSIFISNFSYDKATDLLNASNYVGCKTLENLCYTYLALYFRCIFFICFSY